MRNYWLIIACVILLPKIVIANGFAVNEQSAIAAGMGGAFVAQADDPSAVYYNPAGLVQLKGTQISAGFALDLHPETSLARY